MNIDWTAIGSIGTAVAVLVATWHVRRNTQQARTDFEDDLSREYRELARSIPVGALLGDDLPAKTFLEYFPRLYQYIDLSNEQVFLRMQGRVSHSTWESWCDGIKSNLSLPAFNSAWNEIKERAKGSFMELRRLEKSQFKEDPRKWVPLSKRLIRSFN